MNPCRIRRHRLAWRTLLCAACTALAAFSALDSPPTLAAGKRAIGHQRIAPNAQLPAQRASLPSGPHPGEAMSRQTVTPKKN
ncbi:hypothetical protein WT94_03560 [Burkholderia stagnalis]|nr:hypothetical protein WT76_00455 [Burkholderia stagnalis]KWO33496.1 hypothetical protein WT94_03560 [Burkholderia stagnalis]